MSSDWHHLLKFMRSHRGESLALATITACEGASYRQVGARLLVSARGHYAGSLSGGCLEEGVAQIGRQVLTDGCIRTERINTQPHFGCPGVLTILIEKVEWPSLLEELAEKLQEREPFSITTAESGTFLGVGEGFVEEVQARIRLVVIGWTSDQEPLFKMAEELGWECHRVMRNSRMLAETPRVASEEQSDCAAEDLVAAYAPDPGTAILIMSHHMATDLAYLKAVVPGGYSYIGLLGSRRRRGELLTELGECGLLEDDAWLETFHAPVGFDIGSQHPSTIALSILAEVQAVFGKGETELSRKQGARV